MKIIITEKPSVAREYARILGVSGQQDGYICNNEWIITWCIGHLVTLSYPQVYDEKYAKWNLDDLPFLPAAYKYEVIDKVKKQFGIIKSLYHRTDISTIYLAGDPAREGITIQSYVLNMAGYNKSADVLVVWVDSLTDAQIKKGISEAEPLSAYKNLIDSGYERAIEDYAVGINYSRALTCKFGYRGSDGKNKPVPVGRVMTAVLGMVIDRENEIKNFKETVYYKILADVGFNAEWKAIEGTRFFGSNALYDNTGFLDKTVAGAFINDLSSDMKLSVSDVKTTVEKKNPPTLFNLSELQSECTKRFKISPADTLNVAQKLYEAKLTSYPRTSARVLTKAMFGEITGVFNGLVRIGYKKSEIEHILTTDYKSVGKSKRYVDDSKVADHYAIIPTGQGKTDKLSDLELKIYHLIVDRFLAIFYPAAEYKKTAVTLKHSKNEFFFANSKVLVKEGYMSLYGKEPAAGDEEESDTPINVSVGDVLPVKAFLQKESKTQPPKRYTSGSIILAMENAGKLIEDEELRAQIKTCGIGTEATRAGILDKLIKINHLSLNKKTQILTPSPDGYIVYGIVKRSVPMLLRPEMTASWEKGLSQIESGEITKDQYQKKLEADIKKNVEEIKAMAEQHENSSAAAGEKKQLGKCPICGKPMFEAKDKGYGCTGFNKDGGGCSFFVPLSYSGKKLGKRAIDALLAGKETDVIKGFKSKNNPGKEFEAKLGIKDGKVSFIFEEKKTPEPFVRSFACPKCGEKFEDKGYCLVCKCGVKIYRTISGHELSEQEMAGLLAGRTRTFTDLIKKDGTPFKKPAALVLNDEYKVEYLFVDQEES